MTVDSYRPPSEHGGRAPQPGAGAATPPKGLTGPAAATHVLRPDALGTQHAVAAGHPLAALAAHRILEAGGNAVDAGVAAGICLGVVHSDIVNFAGVAPLMVYEAGRREVTTISGLGVWPRAATLEYFRDRCQGDMPDGLLRTVVPAAPDAWITALERCGTLGFAEVAQPAIELARDGFPLGRFVAGIIQANADAYRRWPTSAPIYLPGGRPPRAGERFVQADLGRTLTHLADEDRAARRAGRSRRARGRAQGLLPGRHRGRDRALPRGRGRPPHARGPRRLPGRRRAADADPGSAPARSSPAASGARGRPSFRCSRSWTASTSPRSATTRRTTSTRSPRR